MRDFQPRMKHANVFVDVDLTLIDGQGRLLPTMAVDHLAEALARWMGVTDSAALDRIAPHRAAFAGNSPLTGLVSG